ncbi:MAG TPA: type II toxin-antitoxin system VapC family toxin, partial [Terricaulis sp.]|nr:type II toxin-antitoxin system VapC family toxin [Terricaulis sp.]
MSVYLDANVLAALFLPDALTPKATAAVARLSAPLLVSDMAALEFVSTVARKVRGGVLSAKDGRIVVANFDAWTDIAARLTLEASDVAAADVIIRRFDINLHGADALHVAMAARAGAALLTLDAKMRSNAKKLGVAV